MKTRRLLIALAATAIAVIVISWVFYVRSTQVIELHIPLDTGNQTPGTLCKAEQVGNYAAPVLRALVWWARLPEPVSVHSGVKLYRLQYWTIRCDGAPTVASGLMGVPVRMPVRGVVSYQHGTNVNRHATPSRPSIGEGVLGAAVLAGGGYIFTAPDYIGLGTSREIHTYLHAESTANAVVDLLHAANAFASYLKVQCPSSVYLVGVSQGGHATLAAHRALEAMNDPRFHVVASAPVAGAYDLSGISFPTALEGASPAHSLYLAYMVNSFCAVYGHPLESVLANPYAKSVPELFDGEHDTDKVALALPSKPRQLFKQEFLKDYDNGRPTWLLDALAKNEVFRWSPKAPIRLYFGERDLDVSPKEAHAAADEFSKRGCDVTLVSVGQYNHEKSIYHAIPKIRAWFDGLGNKPGPA